MEHGRLKALLKRYERDVPSNSSGNHLLTDSARRIAEEKSY